VITVVNHATTAHTPGTEVTTTEKIIPALYNYDVSADGQRFLMPKPIEHAGAAPTQINVVLNSFEELKQKVPVGKK